MNYPTVSTAVVFGRFTWTALLEGWPFLRVQGGIITPRPKYVTKLITTEAKFQALKQYIADYYPCSRCRHHFKTRYMDKDFHADLGPDKAHEWIELVKEDIASYKLRAGPTPGVVTEGSAKEAFADVVHFVEGLIRAVEDA